MKISTKNTDYQEFLSIISGIKTLEKHTILINYKDEVTGTIEQLNEFAKKNENIDLKRFVFNLSKKVHKEISDVEIKKYLKKLTENFDIELTKSALFDLEVYENMVFDETLNEAVLIKYNNEGWEIPTIELLCPIKKKAIKLTDFKKMKNRVFPFINIQLNVAKKYLQKALPPQQTTTENDTIKYTAKHYVLSYLIECNAKGESFPIGQKKELEKIGNRIMGAGKGNRFYKVFNEIVNKDLNIENNLIEIGGKNWRTIVKNLSNEPETIETYLQSKQL